MSGMEYFLNSEHWSISGLFLVCTIVLAYSFGFRTNKFQKLWFGLMLSLFYIAFGSPLADLTNFGMHSISMLQHIVLLMMAPVLLLKAIPKNSWIAEKLSAVFTNASSYFIVVWLLGATAMWGGHFLSAAVYSAKLGTSICGIAVPASSWLANVPMVSVNVVLFMIGFLCNLPVFHPNQNKRLKPVQSVAYLFSSCIVCSVLGLYVAFSAAVMDSVPVFTTLRNPVNIPVRTDQELAGMLMWVPGCILYIIASIEIVLKWYDRPSSEMDNEMNAIHLID